jgi:uncharacterized protein YyaL (SSP411 family)
MSDAAPARRTNRLAREKSPYLRQHAHNPVDWFPWGEEAFAKARAEQKPIFLSIGYSTCHWCHVMAHESFENGAIAAQLNSDFVPVKVDREERPDVDRVYMTYVQATTGHGGWPMSVWLTPGLSPFFGGTYFPPEDRWGRPGFATLLGVLAQAWSNDRDKLEAEGARVVEVLRSYGQRAEAAGERKEPEADLAVAADGAIGQCIQQLAESFDAERGGFGGAPKFPRAAVFNFLFRVAAVHGVASATGAEAVQMATLTLRKMAEGGIHDHVGGGFHRYSVDPEWFVPHFEKMLYDQAQLAISYLEATQATGDKRYAEVARGIFDYVRRDLTDPAGGFYSAEDADSEIPERGDRKPESERQHGQQAEGAFYVWKKEEIARVLGDDAELFYAHYGVADDGNVPGDRDPHGELRGKNHLRQREPVAATARQFGLDLADADDRLSACLVRLQQVRARRPRPHLDDKILAAWNGLMISALTKGHQVLGCRSLLAHSTGSGLRACRGAGDGPGAGSIESRASTLLQAAVRAAEFLRRELYDGGTGVLYRSYRDGRSDVKGFAEDYAFLVQGLLDLYEASFELRWLQWAEQLQARMDALFWDADAGGYFNSRADDPSIIARLKEDYDGAEPAPGSVAALNLLRLDAILGSAEAGVMNYRERAVRCIEAFRGQWMNAPQTLPLMLCAIEPAEEPPRTVVLAGVPGADDFRALVAVLHERLGLRRALLAADGGEGQAWLAARRPYLAEMAPLGGCAAAYVCENFTCRQPVTEPAALRELLGAGASLPF